MGKRTGWFPLGAAAAGAGIACAIVVLCGRPALSPLIVLGGTGGGVLASTVVRRTRGGSAALDEALVAVPEIGQAYLRGIEIRYRNQPPSTRCQRCAFTACRRGREVGRLDVGWIESGRRLYVENIHVADPDARRGIGTALLLSAAKTTDCAVVATSGRTAQGARFFAKNRDVLKRHGIELRDGPA